MACQDLQTYGMSEVTDLWLAWQTANNRINKEREMAALERGHNKRPESPAVTLTGLYKVQKLHQNSSP